jgi:hypothetical protein
MVVLHSEVIAQIVERDARLNIMGGVDIEAAIENMCGGVGGEDMTDQWLGDGFGGQCIEFQQGHFVGHLFSAYRCGSLRS